MLNEPQPKYIELKINRDFGDIITDYFEFLKQNIKKFTNVFLSYNGIFLVGLLITSYLLVSGFIGLITYEQNRFAAGVSDTDETYQFYFIAGGILFFLIFLIVAILNYSISSSYMILYDENEGQNFEKKEVWQHTKNQFGNIVVFIILLFFIYLGFIIVSVILAFIPLIGTLVQYVIQFFITAWLGVSFFCMLREKRGVTDALGEGWNLITASFWKSVGVNFILGLLNGILFVIVLTIPGIIAGVYSFHVVENNVEIGASVVPTIIYTLCLSMFLIIAVYSQCLTQFVNGMLYFTLHEKTYNTFTRSKIEQIGQLEE